MGMMGHKTLQTPKRSGYGRNHFAMTGAFTTFKTGSIFKQAMKAEFAEMKQKVHEKMQTNDRIVEEVRLKVQSWKA